MSYKSDRHTEEDEEDCYISSQDKYKCDESESKSRSGWYDKDEKEECDYDEGRSKGWS